MATEAAAAAEVGKGFHGSSTRKAFFRYPLLAYPNHVVVLTSRPREDGLKLGEWLRIHTYQGQTKFVSKHESHILAMFEDHS